MVALSLVIVCFQGVELIRNSLQIPLGLRQLFLQVLILHTVINGFLQAVLLVSEFRNLCIQSSHAVSLCSEFSGCTLQIVVGLLIAIACNASFLCYRCVQLVIHLTETSTDNHLFVILRQQCNSLLLCISQRCQLLLRVKHFDCNHNLSFYYGYFFEFLFVFFSAANSALSSASTSAFMAAFMAARSAADIPTP